MFNNQDSKFQVPKIIKIIANMYLKHENKKQQF